MEGQRFLKPAEVAEILSTSVVQVMALLHNGDLPAIRLGGRRQFRIEAADLEDYIAREKAAHRAEVEQRRTDVGPAAHQSER